MLLVDQHYHLAAFTVSVTSAAAAAGLDDAMYVLWLGVPLPVILAAFAGAACALSFLDRMTFLQSLIAIMVASAASSYLTPLILWGMDIPSNLSIAIAFAFALFGQTLIGTLFGAFPDAVKQMLWAIVERVKGR
jgi:hypothetical protein